MLEKVYYKRIVSIKYKMSYNCSNKIQSHKSMVWAMKYNPQIIQH